MRFNQHLLILVVCEIALCYGRSVIRNFPLLQFREIGDVKLIYKYENVDVQNYNLQPALDSLLEEIIMASFENNEFVPERESLVENMKKLNYTYNNFLKSSKQSQTLNRQKRWDAFGDALKWAGGVMNADDRNEMRRYLQKIYDNQTKIKEKVDNIMTRLNKPGELKAENSDEKLIELHSDLKRLKESLQLQEFKERYGLFSAKISAIMTSYVNGRLDSDLVDQSIIEKFTNNDNSRLFACSSPLNCLRNSEAIFEFSSGQIKLSLKTPVTNQRSFKLYEVASIPTAYSDYIIFFKPLHRYYAYDEESEELLTFSSDYKQSCYSDSTNQIFCNTGDIITNLNIHDCLSTAIRDKIVDTEICSSDMELQQFDDFAVIKLDKRKFWIHSDFPTSIKLSCIDKDDEVKNITDTVVIDLPLDCRGSINGLKLFTYALNENQHFTTMFSANISKESLRDVINTMSATSKISSDLIFDLDSAKAAGLKEKVFAGEETMHARNQWQENEIKVLHAEHNKFIIVALVLAVGTLLFMVFRRHKSIFILTNQKENEDEPPQYSCEEKDESDTSLNSKSNYK